MKITLLIQVVYDTDTQHYSAVPRFDFTEAGEMDPFVGVNLTSIARKQALEMELQVIEACDDPALQEELVRHVSKIAEVGLGGRTVTTDGREDH